VVAIVLSEFSVRVLLGGIVSITFVLLLASAIHHRYHFTKRAFFTVLSGIIISATIALIAVNLRLMQLSVDGSLTSKNAYLQIIACEQEISIIPEGGVLSQSSGDASHQIYEDGRLQYIGYLTDERLEGSLGGFMQALGGSITANSISIPLSSAMEDAVSGSILLQKFVRTNPVGEKYLDLRSGEACESTPSMVSVFSYEYSPTTHSYTQKRILRSPEEYQFSENRFGEPACIVVIFGEPSERTTKNCNGYPDVTDIVYAEDEE
jgi:hypothetical protein